MAETPLADPLTELELAGLMERAEKQIASTCTVSRPRAKRAIFEIKDKEPGDLSLRKVCDEVLKGSYPRLQFTDVGITW